ncbi:hypothetical protein [Fluviicola taffensis]|uniref:Uncharacterized protein n=1 Tax=Fluviicola taffensis (strain DSM 16823 / NCIMB 13979 / RW262) TaxID=755732 RepID=F2IGT3_FLUTR|nr:hypothetical protein [Fluviicola taffensis]AEA43700.1 hypothetical protein Fluta_1708 [Fluviicola taffensis DSM 16823]
MKKSNVNDPKFKDQLKSFFRRCNSETPPFFKKLRLAGLVTVAAGTALLAAPVALPAALVTVAGYLIVGGTVASAMSQAAIAEDGKKNDE